MVAFYGKLWPFAEHCCFLLKMDAFFCGKWLRFTENGGVLRKMVAFCGKWWLFAENGCFLRKRLLFAENREFSIKFQEFSIKFQENLVLHFRNFRNLVAFSENFSIFRKLEKTAEN